MNHPTSRTQGQVHAYFVDDDDLKRRALKSLMRAIRRANPAVAVNMPAEVVAILSGGLKDQDWPALLAACAVHITVDRRALRNESSAVRASLNDHQMLVCLIQARAGDSLLRALFPQFGREDVASLRRDLKVAAPRLAERLSAADETALCVAWPAVCARNKDPRMRYLALSREFPQYTLYSLFAAINDMVSAGRLVAPSKG